MAKPSISPRLVFAFILTTLTGIVLHFLYSVWPNGVTALFSPVRESIWEHLKVIWWPYLAAMLIVTGKAGRGKRGSWLFSLLVISVTMLIIGYVYHISLGGTKLIFDIGLYIILMALGFWLPGRLEHCGGRSKPVFILIILLSAAILLFTFLPPDHILFSDLSEVHTWYTIPY